MEGNPSTKSLLHALERCSALVAFALPSAACVLCGRADADPDIYGEKSQDNGVCTHENCLVSSPGAVPSFPLVPQPSNVGSPSPACRIGACGTVLTTHGPPRSSLSAVQQ